MTELFWPLSLSVTGVILMALAGYTGSDAVFWSGLAISGLALVYLVRIVLKESAGKAQE